MKWEVNKKKTYSEKVRTIKLENGYKIDLRKIKENVQEDRTIRDFTINAIYYDLVADQFIESEKVPIYMSFSKMLLAISLLRIHFKETRLYIIM